MSSLTTRYGVVFEAQHTCIMSKHTTIFYNSWTKFKDPLHIGKRLQMTIAAKEIGAEKLD